MVPGPGPEHPLVLGTLFVCMAAWQPADRRRAEADLDVRMFAIPTAFGLLAVGLQAYEFVVPVNGLAVLPADLVNT